MDQPTKKQTSKPKPINWGGSWGLAKPPKLRAPSPVTADPEPPARSSAELAQDRPRARRGRLPERRLVADEPPAGADPELLPIADDPEPAEDGDSAEPVQWLPPGSPEPAPPDAPMVADGPEPVAVPVADEPPAAREALVTPPPPRKRAARLDTSPTIRRRQSPDQAPARDRVLIEPFGTFEVDLSRCHLWYTEGEAADLDEDARRVLDEEVRLHFPDAVRPNGCWYLHDSGGTLQALPYGDEPDGGPIPERAQQRGRSHPPPDPKPHPDREPVAPEPRRSPAPPPEPADPTAFAGVISSKLRTAEEEPVFKNLALKGTVTLMWGFAGAGKSFVARTLAGMLAFGHEWMGEPLPREATIYLATEAHRTMQIRSDAWMTYHNANRDDDAVIVVNGEAGGFDITNEQHVSNFIASSRASAESLGLSIGMMILDSWYKSFAGRVPSPERGMAGLRGLRRIATELNCAVLAICHTTKGLTRNKRIGG